MDNEKDRFIEIVKDKLSNYVLPVDDDSWKKIEEQLNPRRKQRLWIAAIAVAASILLLFLLFPVDKKTPDRETANQVSAQKKTINKDMPEKEIVQPTLEDSNYSKVFRKTQPAKRLAENNLITEVIPEEENTPVATTTKEEENEPSVVENPSVSPHANYNFEDDEQPSVIKHKKQRSLRFSFGSGANLSAKNTANMAQSPMNNPGVYLNLGAKSFFRVATQVVDESRTKDILSYRNYPDISCHLPLSFGVTLKKELSRTFAIESGIVYTFLSTTFNSESSPKSHADLQLHYLGIPLNLHTRIYGNRFSKWEAYLSAGGMVEKGIYSHFVQKTFYDTVDNEVQTIVSNEKIKGWQWSVNISPGVDYRIYKNYSIYAEPKISYFFDNDQPPSARTNHPIAVGINAGIRYTW